MWFMIIRGNTCFAGYRSQETNTNSGAVEHQLERLAAGLAAGQGAGAGGPGADAEAESQAGASTVAGGRRQQQAKQKAQVKPNWKGKHEVGGERERRALCAVVQGL